MADQQQWHGQAFAKLTRSTPDQIWPLYADFCNYHKYISIIDTCCHVEGTPDPPQLGCVRYSCGAKVVSTYGIDKPGLNAYEKLVTFDPIERCLSYEITDNPMGFKNYIATIKVLPGYNDNQKGCVIEWSYVVDPIEGWKQEDLFALISSGLESVALSMEAEANPI